ncbi:MAG: GxxExxY protein [Chloroflexota bacterium]
MTLKYENDISFKVIGSAIEVHTALGGPGLLENMYEEALVYELKESGLKVARQKPVPVQYKGIILSDPLRVDILVEDSVVVECKAVEKYNTLYEAQTLTYLRLLRLRLGLVINFGARYIKNGTKRVVNGL